MAINVADNFSYKGGKPLDNRTKYTSVADMVATPAADLYDGCLAYVTAIKKNYQYDSTNETDPTLGKWRELQTGGGGGTDYTAGDGIDITDDTISIDEMPSEDMDEIVSPKPVTAKGGHRYSTEEQIVGIWIDGRNIYEKTVEVATGTCTQAGIGVQTEFDFTSDTVDWSTVISTTWQTTFISNFDVAPTNTSSTPVTYRLCGVRIIASATVNKIIIQCSLPAFSDTTFYVTVQYVKA